VPRISYNDLTHSQINEESSTIKKRIELAREIQLKRFKGRKILTNSEMSAKETEEFCPVEKSAENLLKNALEKDYISGRAYFRILKIGRTIADLSQCDILKYNHIAEALSYKIKVEK